MGKSPYRFYYTQTPLEKKGPQAKKLPAISGERSRCGLHSFLDLGSLAHTVAEVVELGSADLALADGLDLHDAGGMQQEHLLAADAVGDTADGEGLLQAAMLLGDDGPSLIFT